VVVKPSFGYAPRPGMDPSFPASFRSRVVDGAVLVTNPAGQYAFLEPAEFDAFTNGQLDPQSEAYRTLAARNFIRTELRISELRESVDLRKSFLDFGPNLHVIEITLRCNQTCLYCHLSRVPMDEAARDMTVETADRVVDLVFQSTSPSLTLEFQGGEPLANFPVLQHVVDRALEKNRTAGKTLQFALVTNLSLMDDEKLAFLLDRRVQICTSIDGPAALHDVQRKLASGSSFATAATWIWKLNDAYQSAGLDPHVYHVEGLLTTTRETLSQPRAIVDTYRELGFRALFLRPVDPFGFAAKTQRHVTFTAAEYLEFYRQAVDYMIELNLRGEQILERYAAILLTKILTGEDPNFLDLRSPCGAGIGQVAYSHDGQIFTCDEARMLHHMGDDFFRLGDVRSSTYRAAVGHDTVRAITVASNLDGSPDCASCVYNPYCGICPVYNYATQGSLHGQLRTSPWCAMLMGIQDHLFTKLRRADPQVREVLERWIAIRPRAHYLHPGGSTR
jgi:uncharacterized protein